MRKRRGLALLPCVALAAFLSGCRTPLAELSPPVEVRETTAAPVAVATAERMLPIVTEDTSRFRWAASHLADVIERTCGRRPDILVELNGQTNVWTEGLFIGKVSANRGWTCPLANKSPEAFRVVAGDGCVRFLGRADYAVFDWCERELGFRYYCPVGKCAERRAEIVARAVDYSDCPVFERRQIGSTAAAWVRTAKAGSSHRGGVAVHAPHGWYRDRKLKAEHPEIFETGETPMLCYGNPATLDYYKRRIGRHIAGLEDSGGIVNTNRKVVTVCQWDAPIRCRCSHCRGLYDASLGSDGNASPVIWGHFLKELSTWLAVAHPDYMISFLPYLNTCEVPKEQGTGNREQGTGNGEQGIGGDEDPVLRLAVSLSLVPPVPGFLFPVPSSPFPFRNCEAEVCTMSGLALLKDPDCKRNEERILREWHRVTGNKVLSWHYSCWPADKTSAPYVFGRTVQTHCADMRDEVCGSYVCGPEDDPRLALSSYVWMRCLWNPDVDVGAVYDGFARRMFGPGAKPMRELIDLQEKGWSRTWEPVPGSRFPVPSYHNVFEISYPRADVERMVGLLREAHGLAVQAKDEVSQKRIAWYASGFERFLVESAALARRTGRKSVALGTTNEMVVARSVTQPHPWAKTTVTTSVDGTNLVLFISCFDPAVGKMDFSRRDNDFLWGDDGVTFVFGDEKDARRVTVYLDGEIERGNGWKDEKDFAAEVFSPTTSRSSAPCWSIKARVRLSDENLASGKILGNVCRWRVGDRRKPKAERVAGSRYEQSRLDTCYTFLDADPAAFVEFRLR